MAVSRIIQWLFKATFFILPEIIFPTPFSMAQGKKLPYMTSDVEEVSGRSFDYIIVGGGTTGCPLAATLSEKFSVLLVERGSSPYGNPLVTDKRYYGFSLLKTDEYSSIAQSFISRDGVMNHRGRVLGGSSAINGGFYSRASSDFVKGAGWDEARVAEAYEWVESRVVSKPELTQWQFVAEFGLLEAGILPYNGYTLEHLEGTKIGGSLFDPFGTRHTSADLLEAGHPENITVLLSATVNNIIFNTTNEENKTRAAGIAFIKSEVDTLGTYEAYLNKPGNKNSWGDVILAAGALGSPQILLLSGIGPPKHLKKFGIPVVLDLKGIGRGMKDNPCIALLADNQPQNRLPDPPQVAGIAKNLKYIVEAGILPVSHNTTRIPVAVKYAFPKSKGRLKLNSTDPRDNPSVKFNYLDKEEDLKACIEMVQLLQKVIRSQSVTLFLGAEHKQAILAGEEELSNFCKKNVRTFYHYHGGCAIGTVVSSDYQLLGVNGLRVIDGSTLVESPGTNPMATLMMLGRYQGINILQQRRVADTPINR